jgi:asparagine synthetase B (glutamine-hydrolysing)
MRIGLVIGAPADVGIRRAAELARGGAPSAAATATPVAVDGLCVAVSQADLGRISAGPRGLLLHDGWTPGDDGAGSEDAGAHPPAGGVVLIAEPRRGRVTVARDPVGVRPFHLTRTAGGLVLGASQLAGLAACGDVEHIEVLAPGHRAVLDGATIDVQPCAAAPGDEHLGGELGGAGYRQLRSAVAEAVRARVPDGDYAVLLSGGLDSSTVLVLARAVNPRVRAVTVAAAGSPDACYARRLTDALDVPLEIVDAPPEAELLAGLDDMVARVETWESQVLTHAFPTWTALSALSGRIRVVLTGEGSDELFGGYRSGRESDAESRRHRLRELGNLHRTSCQRLDRLGAGAGLDVRLPFLAPAVVRTALALPSHALYRQGLSKWALREAMRADLPDYVLDRPKLTFARGAGYRYGRQAAGAGLLADRFDGRVETGQPEGDLFDRLAVGALERHTLRRFLELRFGKATYLMSRTL